MKMWVEMSNETVEQVEGNISKPLKFKIAHNSSRHRTAYICRYLKARVRRAINIVTGLLKALKHGARKKPLLGKQIPNAGNNRRTAVSITIEENDYC
jgi:hypothetical protein